MSHLSPGRLGRLVAGFLLLVAIQPAAAQSRKPDPAAKEKKPAEPISLPVNPAAQKQIEEATRLIHSESWPDALRILQAILDGKEDTFLEVRDKRKGPDGKETETFRRFSAKHEANRLIGALPANGSEEYEKLSGPKAEALLKEANQKSDAALWAEVSFQYRHTKAGLEATRRLAMHFLEHGGNIEAALAFERLFSHREAKTLRAETLFHATLAFRRSGDEQLAERTWKQLVERVGKEGLRIGDRVLTREQLEKDLKQAKPKQPTGAQLHWTMFRGNASRSAQGIGGAPFLEATWRVSTLPPRADWVKQAIDSAVDYLEKQRQQPVLPAFFPIAAGGKLVYRAHDALYARNVKTGRLEWYQSTRGSLDNMVREHAMRRLLEQEWRQMYAESGPQGVYFENSLLGSLSTDGKLLYAIDDVAVPPPAMYLQQFLFGKPQYPQLFAEFFQNHNDLMAVELDTGKLKWELPPGLPPEGERKPSEFDDTYFLGAPLPLAGKLYVLTERNTELRLVCIDPTRMNDRRSPEVVWTQTLAKVRDRFATDSFRRLHAAHVAYGDGILVCPTNAGTVLGIDPLSHKVVWAHTYPRPVPPKRNQDARGDEPALLSTTWRNSAPVIQDGKVVFTAPDAESLLCLNIRDGRLLWQEKRTGDDLYLAGVYGGKVLIVSKNACRALNLKDGKPAWKIDNVGIPSGQGVASGDIYYLPLRAGGESKEPEVCAIDINKGVIVAHARARKRADGKMEVPGNLLFFEGSVVSQTATDATAYPQLKIKLKEMNDRLDKNRKDPAGLTERGILLLDQGRLEQAVEDFRTALANQPPADVLPRLRAKLYEALTELFQRDFNAAEKYLKEYEESCKVEAPQGADPQEQKAAKEEEQRRTAVFLSLLAGGRESQGRLLDALEAYVRFGTVAESKQLLPIIAEPGVSVRPEIWAHGRIEALLARAKLEERKQLEERIAEKWQAAEKPKDAGTLRRFLAMFGETPAAGRRTRLRLAEELAQQNNADAQQEAELHLLQLRSQRDDPQSAARAGEALARLMLQRGLLDDAMYYYRELGRDFAKTVIRDSKTGADFFNEIATDKRFLPYLETPLSAWTGKRLEARKLAGNFPAQPLFGLEPDGDVQPFFRRHRVAIDMNYWHLKLTDTNSNEEYWKSPNLVQAHYLYNNYPNLRHTYHTQGHILFLNLGHMVYAFDVIAKRKLWEFNLYAPGSPAETATPPQNQVQQGKDGTLHILYPDGWMQVLGGQLVVRPSYVCLQTRNGLVAVDPASGGMLWQRTDIGVRSRIFGDDQYVFVVEIKGDGIASGTKAVSARDGTLVRSVPDFAPLYNRRLRIVGRNLLVKDDDPKTGVTLRLYDVLTGKDLWKQTFPVETVVLRSEDPNLAGTVEPNGAVTVVDLRTKKVALKTAVKREDIDKVQDVYLLLDSDQFYIAFSKPVNPEVTPWGDPVPNVMYGMRSIPVNGMIYAFERTSGRVRWWQEIRNQMLLIDRFSELPVLLLTSRYDRIWRLGRIGAERVVPFKSIDKRTGKLLMDEELPNRGNQFYALNVDAKSGKIELLSYNLKIVHEVRSEAAPKNRGSRLDIQKRRLQELPKFREGVEKKPNRP